MARPDRLVVVVGTGTEVGKTWVTAQLAGRAVEAGRRVAARKPAQSFAPGDVERAGTDAQLLGAATGEAPDDVCPRHRWFDVPMAPPMAAEALGRPSFTIADLADELSWPDGIDLGFVETAGGVRSPLADDGDAVDLVRLLDPDEVVVVADAGLGTINAVRLTVAALDTAHVRAPLVHLNRFVAGEDLHDRNRAWLTERDQLEVTTGIDALARALTVGDEQPH